MYTAEFYVINTFAKTAFSGNPAGVMLLEHDLDDELLKKIVEETRLSEMSFIRKRSTPGQYDIRWFTPKTELDICGHGTLGAAHVIFSVFNDAVDELSLFSKKDVLKVSKEKDCYKLTMPAIEVTQCDNNVEIAMIERAVLKPRKIYRGRSYLLWLDSENDVMNYQPNIDQLLSLHLPGVIIAAYGKETDYVCRYFAPQKGINEDPVTGTAHNTISTLLAKNDKKNKFSALQLSERGGVVNTEVGDGVVDLIGSAYTAMKGQIFIDTQ